MKPLDIMFVSMHHALFETSTALDLNVLLSWIFCCAQGLLSDTASGLVIFFFGGGGFKKKSDLFDLNQIFLFFSSQPPNTPRN